ncbi:uncharacterized protein LOC121405735 [Lytechinus variegatus]|uniref:uncharacterized protein LOC121405735 n=1 Tax=Lytechinus variegatus TaxID=7654 RepID=UPI001BB1711F|nr:uncharacterized protein LOC121405735 [Lytechinus variegatus]XP_041452614.1 uncharacterized protein LOC121405735 [Lytechinus variegatus]XP_041452615.1 uncharacterized protein LOC121405735 [Lytechinus variegatus]
MGNDLHCLRPKNGMAGGLEPNCFKVRNVNESGHVVNKGYLEVTQTDLILHVVNADPVKWPLRCLRRYGHDTNLFSFESGRRCATGPGIYAFKSKHAIEIFRLVQENAQHTDENTSSNNNPISRTSRQRSLSTETALPPGQTMSRASSNASGMNGVAHGVSNGGVSPHPSVSSDISYAPPTSPRPTYFNVDSNSSCSPRISPISPTMQYVNTIPFGDTCIPESPLEATHEDSLMADGGQGDTSQDSFGDPALNYARLKLPSDEDQTKVEKDKDKVRGEKDDDKVKGDEGKDNARGEKDDEKVKAEKDIDRVMGKNGEGRVPLVDLDSEGQDGGEGETEEPKKTEEEKMNEGVCEGKENPERTLLGILDDEGQSKDRSQDVPDGLINHTDGNTKDELDKVSSTFNDFKDDDDPSKKEVVDDGKTDVSHVMGSEGKDNTRLKVKKNGKREVSEMETTALLQDVANGNIRLKDRSMESDSKLNILVNYANLTEQQLQDVLQKLEMGRNDNISPCTVCSNSSSNASQRVSPLSYYANLDTAGELPPNWQPNFQFYPELRTPRSTSSKGSTGSEFTFELNRGSCSPVDHNYANLNSLPEVQPMRHSLSGSSSGPNGAGGWMELQPPPKGKMNYIQLDFDENDQPIVHNLKTLHRSMSSSTTPPKTPVSTPTESAIPGTKTDIYARIDIEKTVALANSHRHVEGDPDISTRRTRHDVWTDNKTR